MSFASLEPVNQHLATPALAADSISAQHITPAGKKNISIASPRLSLSTRMSSIDLPDADNSPAPEPRDELQIVARAQPTQNHSDLGAAGANNHEATAVTVEKTVESSAEKTYKEENNYLLALALILLSGSIIAFALFYKWR